MCQVGPEEVPSLKKIVYGSRNSNLPFCLGSPGCITGPVIGKNRRVSSHNDSRNMYAPVHLVESVKVITCACDMVPVSWNCA